MRSATYALTVVQHKVSSFACMCGISALVGYLGWNGSLMGMVAVPLFIFAWSRAENRKAAFAIAFCYYIVAGRCLYPVGKEFWGLDEFSTLRGVLILIAPTIVLASIWALCWSRDKIGLRTACALLLVTIPPFGIIGWTSPLSVAGALFPAFGWFGLVLTLGLLLTLPAKNFRITAILLLLAVCANIFALAYPAKQSTNVQPVSTTYGNTNLIETEFDRIAHISTTASRILRNVHTGSLIVFPETIISTWGTATGYLSPIDRLARSTGSTVLIGGVDYESNGKVINGLYRPGYTTPVIQSRIPVPLGLWKPWSRTSVDLHLFGDGIFHMHEKKIAAFICYEQLLNWPILVSFLHSPDMVIAPSNSWFANGSSLNAIQQQNASAWARLFRTPIFFSVNQ